MPPAPSLTLRPLTRADLPTLRQWLNTPHVYEWWGRHMGAGALGGPGDAAATADEVEAKYGPTIDTGGSTHRSVIMVALRPIGLIQWYRLADFPEYAAAIGEDAATTVGLDLLIGDGEFVGRGLGPKACDLLATGIIFEQTGITRIVAGPARTNLRSIRAFAKAGFRWVREVSITGEPVPEAILRRDKAG